MSCVLEAPHEAACAEDASKPFIKDSSNAAMIPAYRTFWNWTLLSLGLPGAGQVHGVVQAAPYLTRPHVRGLAPQPPSRKAASTVERRRWQAHSDNAEQSRLFDVPVQPYNPDAATSRHSQLSNSPLQLPCRSTPAAEETESRHWLLDAVAAHGASVRQTAAAFALAGVLLAGAGMSAPCSFSRAVSAQSCRACA